MAYEIKRAKRQGEEPLFRNTFLLEQTPLEYLTFPLLERTGVVRHLFTTRTGGVSDGEFSSLNLSWNRGDDRERVLENYRRVGRVLGIGIDRMTLSVQTHTTNIRVVTENDAGKGLVRPADYQDVDGLITDVEHLALVTSFADCVPLYFVDPKRRVIGLAHSGWRGTAERMGAHMVDAMTKHFGSKPEELYAAIGPSICQDCYEVSKEVAERFERLSAENEDLEREITESGYLGGTSGRYSRMLEAGREPDKYQLDLWRANLLILRGAGIPLSHIAVTDVCTCHNPDYLFSHRASNGKRGNLSAFLMLEEYKA
ncbi:MAG: peptidoglycan editing factor PgeF [Candidatus Gastranaerophilales bacterium]|nr:peptidoglycan editing factor PgeF [Candidatus Gastranaerophilales bacterium]